MAQVPETPEQASVADGATASFPISFTFEAAEEVRVAVVTAAGVRTDQTLDVDYVISGANVVFLSGHFPPSGARVERRRQTAVEQPVPFGDDATFRPTANEAGFDVLTRMVQEDRARGDRGLSVPIGETGTVLAPASVRASALPVWDAAGDLTQAAPLAEGSGIMTIAPSGAAVVMSFAAVSGQGGDDDFDGGLDGVSGTGDDFNGGLDG